MSTPDTTEAVAEAVAAVIYRENFIDTREWSSTSRSILFSALTETAIEADRQALAEQGYVIVKPVKFTRQQMASGIATEALYAFVDKLRELGLPIEIEE